jgi:hypothetical protein
MRQLLRALIVAAVAAVVLVVGARAESRAELRAEARSEPRAELTAQSAPISQRPPLYARVVKQFGAAIRVVPSSDAAIMFNTRCGDVWPVLAVEGGWVKVRTDHGTGWIGGSRVIVSSTPAQVDCPEARFLFPMGYVSTFVPSGCLSLRTRPSPESPNLTCVVNGHVYAVLDGPFDPGTGDDWFKVTSPGTGTGWALAEHLYPT